MMTSKQMFDKLMSMCGTNPERVKQVRDWEVIYFKALKDGDRETVAAFEKWVSETIEMHTKTSKLLKHIFAKYDKRFSESMRGIDDGRTFDVDETLQLAKDMVAECEDIKRDIKSGKIKDVPAADPFADPL